MKRILLENPTYFASSSHNTSNTVSKETVHPYDNTLCKLAWSLYNTLCGGEVGN